MTEEHESRLGEIRAVNYRVGVTDDGEHVYGHRLEQYTEWGWQPIRVYDGGEAGELTEVPQ